MKQLNLRLTLLLFTVLAGINFSAEAQGAPEPQPLTWNGSISTDWDNPNNWTPNVVPTASSEITIPLTANAPTFTGVKTVDDFSISSGASLTVPVGATLNITGDLDMYSDSDSYSSLIVDGTISVTGTTKYHRFTNSQTNGNDLIAPPLSGQTWSSFLSSDSNYNEGLIFNNGSEPTTTFLFGPFEKGTTDDYVLFDDNSSDELTTGKGYRTATNTGTGAALTFTGTVVTGPVTTTIENDMTGEFSEWNLIGNPYPSYIDLETFLNHVGSVSGVTNLSLLDASTAAVYGYNANSDDTGSIWTVINLATGSTLIAPGQGFFVSSSLSTANLEFTPDMQVAGTDDDFIYGRSPDANDFLELKMESTSNNWSTSVYFNENASNGLDLGYDASIFGNSIPDFCLYSHLLEDNEGLPLAIQTLHPSACDNVSVPLGVSANQGQQITFSIENSLLPAATEVHLIDNLTGISTLLNSSDYTFTANTTISGTGRFFLNFTTDTLSLEETNLNDVNIYSNQSSRTILVDGILRSETIATVYDLNGRIVLQDELDTTLNRNIINTNELNTGVYVVKIQSDNYNASQKVILN